MLLHGCRIFVCLVQLWSIMADHWFDKIKNSLRNVTLVSQQQDSFTFWCSDVALGCCMTVNNKIPQSPHFLLITRQLCLTFQQTRMQMKCWGICMIFPVASYSAVKYHLHEQLILMSEHNKLLYVHRWPRAKCKRLSLSAVSANVSSKCHI